MMRLNLLHTASVASVWFVFSFSSSNTWEPVSNLTGCPEMLQEFERTHNLANDSESSTSKGHAKAKKKTKLDVKKKEKEQDASSLYDSDMENGGTKSNSIVSFHRNKNNIIKVYALAWLILGVGLH